jgi:UDP:flavonoid glycosyltransferase YjiC (YdhE family)
VHVERFVAQAQVLDRVDLVVHHGGYGTVLGALAAGLPKLILPQGADQFHNARSLAELGAARALVADEQVPGTIGAAVAALLRIDAPERAVIAGIRDEIMALPAPADVVPELDRLVAGA